MARGVRVTCEPGYERAGSASRRGGGRPGDAPARAGVVPCAPRAALLRSGELRILRGARALAAVQQRPEPLPARVAAEVPQAPAPVRLEVLEPCGAGRGTAQIEPAHAAVRH